MQQHGSPLCVAYVTSPVSRWVDVQGNIDLAGLIDNTDKGPVIKLTAYSKQGRCMTIQEISNMSFEELAAVHTVTPLCCIGFARLSSIYINSRVYRACLTCQYQLSPRTSLHLQLLRHGLIVHIFESPF